MGRHLVVGVAALLASCAGMGEQARLERFDQTARAYERAIRWSDFSTAMAMLRAPGQMQASDLERLKDIRVTSYDARAVRPSPDGTTIDQIVEIRYVNVNSMVERSLTDLQHWVYVEDENRWSLQGSLPAFR